MERRYRKCEEPRHTMKGPQTEWQHLQTCQHKRVDNVVLPSTLHHEIHKDEAVFPLAPHRAVRPKRDGRTCAGVPDPHIILIFHIITSLSAVMPVSGLSGAGCVWILSFCVLLQSSARCGPVPRPGGAVDEVDMQEVLGQFLQVLNWTDQGPRLRPRSGRTEPPEYMLELYERFTSDRSTAPSANIVRSFRNEDHTSHGELSESLRTHRLLFNISVPRHERVVSAELRLHMLLKTDSRHRTGAGWKVSVYDTHRDGRCGNAEGERDPLASKHVHRKDSGWEAFDMTNAIQHWRKISTVTPSLEVHIENLQAFRNANDWPVLDIDRNLDGKHEPALIVFSDDTSDIHQGARSAWSELKRMENQRWTDESVDQDEALLTQTRSNLIYDDGPRVRRSAKTEDCRKAEMYVDFKDIGWDSFVLAPSGYQAFTCRGACNYPLAREVTPTKHAIVQTLLNLKSPQRAAQACCVPTELKPISLLYENEHGVVVLNNKYEGMVVKECGCR
ncbi:bone morphogenetic protein 10 [Sinocyclocheilus anshuiensis]|uniref:bone morphogenetic protein 10 n=1 Tax=Sinocyclocheilus anshuiensis TaxID=1608454 RepID=UPI0007B8B16E|nr:PREDICTED: bone morphogenetic protein 10-like [Sinocyclocheilus anshuiensis]